MRYAITIEYMGANYSGWQRQDGIPTVQETLENKLSEFFQEKITIFASGRTDKGVHALGQVAHFDTAKERNERSIRLGINTLLPEDVRVISCKKVADSFHAQYSALRKTYIYKLYISENISPTRRHTHAQVKPKVDVNQMKEACKLLLGDHDFDGFSSTHKEVKTTNRTIYKAEIAQNGDELTFTIEGSGFLYNMVRVIVGTLVFIGKGKRPLEVINDIFEKKDRTLGGKTFPAEGLYLKDVYYGKEL